MVMKRSICIVRSATFVRRLQLALRRLVCPNELMLSPVLFCSFALLPLAFFESVDRQCKHGDWSSHIACLGGLGRSGVPKDAAPTNPRSGAGG